MRGIQISAPRFKRNPREAAVATVATRLATATPVDVPSHSDIWGDIGDAVPKVPPAAADDDFGVCSACGLSSVVCYGTSNKDDAGGGSDEHNSNDYSGVARQQRGSPISRTNGESALVGAARRGATEAVRALLGAGATVNVASASGETALDTAMVNGQLSAALALVRAGATVSRTDDRLLRVATLRGDDELVSLLLQAGAPPLLARPATIGEPELLADEEEPGATSCLLLAARHPITRILSAYLNFFAVADDGGQVLLEAPHGLRRVTALMVAAANGSRDDAHAVKALLAAGCSPFAADIAGRSALHRAAAADSSTVITALTTAARLRVESPAYRKFVNACEASGPGHTALHCSAAAGADTAIAALLAAGADATVLDTNGASALNVAVTSSHASCVQQLLGMTDAVLDGDIAVCVALARQGNWPVEACVELLIEELARGSASSTVNASTQLGPAPLAAAARRGDIEAVCALVEEAGADATLSDDLSPLAAGATAGCLAVCGEFVSRGAQPAAALMDSGLSLLRAACAAGNTSVVQRLLGAFNSHDLNRDDLRSALHAAASRADDDAVEALLAFGHSHQMSAAFLYPLSLSNDAATSLILPCKTQSCDYLVQFPEPGNACEPALLAACRAGATTCVAALTRHAESLHAALDKNRRCALHHVAACDQALLVERLCSLDGSLVTCRDAYGATSLHAAAAAGAGAAIGALLRHGADATFEDSKGRTPRDVALERNQERAAAQLDAMADAIDDGDFDECARLADAGNWPVDWCALSGDTALVAAARRGAPDAVSRLLACGATVDAVTYNDETPLAAAATAGHLDVCAALLAAGADPTKVTDRSASLLAAAVVADEPELVDALLARGASARPVTCRNEPTSAFLVAIELGSRQIVDSFVQRAIATGALDVNEPHGDAHVRALHAAAARGRADIVQSLLKAGAQVDVLDNKGKSALHYAAGHDHDDVLRVLVSKGADVLRQDMTGTTPLNVAIAQGAKSAESALLMAESMLHPTT